MDRSLKARLIGASVLVLVVVLVVPELLSGRKPATTAPATPESGKGPTRTYTIELPQRQPHRTPWCHARCRRNPRQSNRSDH
jgi:cell division septation protein DedD